MKRPFKKGGNIFMLRGSVVEALVLPLCNNRCLARGKIEKGHSSTLLLPAVSMLSPMEWHSGCQLQSHLAKACDAILIEGAGSVG